jgi:hypothetical protein
MSRWCCYPLIFADAGLVSEPSPVGIVTLRGYLTFWGWAFALVTLGIAVLKSEGREEEEEGGAGGAAAGAAGGGTAAAVAAVAAGGGGGGGSSKEGGKRVHESIVEAYKQLWGVVSRALNYGGQLLTFSLILALPCLAFVFALPCLCLCLCLCLCQSLFTGHGADAGPRAMETGTAGVKNFFWTQNLTKPQDIEYYKTPGHRLLQNPRTQKIQVHTKIQPQADPYDTKS